MGSYFSSFTGCASPHFRQYGATPAPCASSETHPIFDQVTGHKIHGQRTTAFSFEIFGLASTAGHPLFCSPPLGFAGVLNTPYTRSKAPTCFSAIPTVGVVSTVLSCSSTIPRRTLGHPGQAPRGAAYKPVNLHNVGLSMVADWFTESAIHCAAMFTRVMRTQQKYYFVEFAPESPNDTLILSV